jgi:hypothetical protein
MTDKRLSQTGPDETLLPSTVAVIHKDTIPLSQASSHV